MSTTSVRFSLLCTADDPQVPARVMGIFAARSLLRLATVEDVSLEVDGRCVAFGWDC